jgi:hypothetical protein
MAVVLLLAMLPAIALARKIGSAVPAGISVPYKGSDSAGTVTFNLHVKWSKGSPFIEQFTFATSCSTHRTTVAKALGFDSSGRFGYHAGGISLAGRVASRNGNATGTVSVDTATCHAGPLKFTAKPF